MQIKQPPSVMGHRLHQKAPINQLAAKRMKMDRDLKIIITAEDSETGTGKTTAAGWLALNWNQMFAGKPWKCESHATLDPNEYFKLQQDMPPGSVLIVDDAEELDARRSMQSMNLEFSQRWMLMRVRQIITILTLPSPAALDSRLEELADVWINVKRRGLARVHDIRVQSYGKRNVMTETVQDWDFPDVSDHPELVKLRQLKDDKINKILQSEEEKEDDSMSRQSQIIQAKNLRSQGATWKSISEADGMEYSREFYRENVNDEFGDPQAVADGGEENT